MSKGEGLTPQKVWKRYTSGISFNSKIQLDEEVETNENFFIGKQWEGVQSNGLPTPVFNFLKRVTLFTVASVTSDNIKMQAQPLGNSGAKGAWYRMTSIINNEFDSLFEHNKIGSIMREYMRNAAVDGDGCTYSYWDPDAETGQTAKGAIVTEIVENTRVYFGNPNDRRVQTQPYIILERLMLLDEAKEHAKELGKSADDIVADDTDRHKTASEQMGEADSVVVLLCFYKDKQTGNVWCYECTRTMELSHKDTGLKLYPITWLNWDYRMDNYHGQSLISGLIPNQIFINKLFAMCMISLMTTAYPKIVYDKTRISKWSNNVGAAIGVNGGDINTVAKIIDPAQISPQIAQFIQLAVEYTEKFLGATPVAMGDSRPDNTSAIIALQRAASTPHELTKQNLYSSVEDLGRIYIDFMTRYYGVRTVASTIPKEIPPDMAQFAGVDPGGEASAEFDFSILGEHPFLLKLDVGASAYWSEIASMQTLDNLLMQGKIEIDDYLERVPDGYISARQALLDKIRGSKQVMGQMQELLGQQNAPSGEVQGGKLLTDTAQMPVAGGRGNGALQRKINQTGETQ